MSRDAYEREAEAETEHLEFLLENGQITLQEFNKKLRQIERETDEAIQIEYEQDCDRLREDYFGR